MSRLRLPAILLSLSILTACAGSDGNEGETYGAAAGAVIGGVIGAKTGSGSGKVLSGGLGAVFGAWLGKVIGRNLDEADLQKAEESGRETMETAATGETTSWSNPDSGNSGTYTPTSESSAGNDRQCRDFESTVIIDGSRESASGRACRQEDGAWKIVE